MSEHLLEVNDLRVHFPTDDGLVKAVDGVSFVLDAGERLGVVGESGSGKSVTFLALMGLLNRKATRITGEILFRGVNLLELRPEEFRRIRGSEIGMVFQDPMSSLHPLYKVGKQIAEAIQAHEKNINNKDAFARAVDMLERVGIPRPEERARQYPHEFSGGMRQRAMIAMGLCLSPDLLIADEPTTALDVTVQAQILDLIDRMRDEFQTAVVMITHDLGVVAEHTDRVQVMYAGRIVEKGSINQIYHGAHHPYTWGLMQSISRLDEDQDRLRPIKGAPPSLIHVPTGCSFHPRCPYVMDICKTQDPQLQEEEYGHSSACLLSLEEKKRIFESQVEVRA